MNEETSVDQTDLDLDDFSTEFFGQTSADPQEEATPEDDVKTEDESDAPTNDESVDTLDEDDTLDNEDEGEEETPKPKKNRFQERIDELTTARREAERREQALAEKLSALEEKFNKTAEPVKTAQAEVNDGPTPDDKNEDGSDKYPLGEYDPNFIRDHVKHTLETERKAYELEKTKELEQRKVVEAQAELQTSWNSKLAPAQERYPDFMEKSTEFVNAFSDLNPAYSEYLSTTLMSMDYGTDVLYYLANNPDEARKIVDSGAAKATVALGRLEAKFAFADEEKQKARPKVSKAPTPPPINRGSAVSNAEVPDDTDDLDAFANKLFKKRG